MPQPIVKRDDHEIQKFIRDSDQAGNLERIKGHFARLGLGHLRVRWCFADEDIIDVGASGYRSRLLLPILSGLKPGEITEEWSSRFSELVREELPEDEYESRKKAIEPLLAKSVAVVISPARIG
jgi:hypothetical protein